MANAVLTGAVGFSSKRSLIEKIAASGRVPCSGAERRNKELTQSAPRSRRRSRRERR